MQRIEAETVRVISDLHLVGEGAREDFECEAELVSFLESLAGHAGLCLVILGDFFDFWQSEGSPGEKIERIGRRFPRVFAALRALTARGRAVFLPGNHDRDAMYDEAVRTFLAGCGVEVIADEAIEIALAGMESVRISAEPGHVSDPYNAYAHAPQPAEHPFGEHLMRQFINPLKSVEVRPGESWLREIDNVHPLGAVPWWALSKYFYYEAGWWVKALAVPSALLFGFTKIGLVLLALRYFGVDLQALGVPPIPKPIVYLLLGFLGIDAFVLVLGVFVWLLRRDALGTLKRWGIEDLEGVLRARERQAEARARACLGNTGARLYLHGHTHDPFLRELPGAGAWANSGAWVKRMHRIRPRFYLPPVFVPGFLLTYLSLESRDGVLQVELRARQKAFGPRLTFLGRLAILFRPRPRPLAEPDVRLARLVLTTEA